MIEIFENKSWFIYNKGLFTNHIDEQWGKVVSLIWDFFLIYFFKSLLFMKVFLVVYILK